MSLQQYLNNDVLATISETVSGTLSTISVFAVPMTMAKSGDVVFIINKGTGRQYQITLTADLNTSVNRISFSSTTFDTPIPEGSIVIQKQADKYSNLFRKYTTVNIPFVNRKTTHLNDNVRDEELPSVFMENIGTTLSNGDSVNAIFSSLYNSFITPTNGAKIENIKYTLNTNAGFGRGCKIFLFELPIAVNSNSNQTITLIESQTFLGLNDATLNYFTNSNPNHDLASGSCLFATFRKQISADAGDVFTGSVELLISFDPR